MKEAGLSEALKGTGWSFIKLRPYHWVMIGDSHTIHLFCDENAVYTAVCKAEDWKRSWRTFSAAAIFLLRYAKAQVLVGEAENPPEEEQEPEPEPEPEVDLLDQDFDFSLE